MPNTLHRAPTSLPEGFCWHQSSVSEMLRCARRFRLRYVERAMIDHQASNYANLLGTADHAGIEYILHRVNEAEGVNRNALLDHVLDAFGEAMHRAQEKGEHTDPDGLERAIDRIETERVERLLRLANDDRIHAVHWRGIEHRFDFIDGSNRRWRGTIDAWGVACRSMDAFGALGREPAGLDVGEHILVDWKTGDPQPFGRTERILSVQLGIYAMALSREVRAPWRTFLAYVQDLDRPKAPTDENKKRIPKRLPKQINPAFAAALELSPEAAAKSRRGPKGAGNVRIPKWLPEQDNPAFIAACKTPKGPLFREARVDYRRVLQTVQATVRQAELGIYPAAGAINGHCARCAYQAICTRRDDDRDN